MGNDGEGDTGGTIFRDIRRFYCQYCGICRSKRCLITSHILSHHQEEMKEQEIDGFEEKEGLKPNVCEDCGAIFNKPAYLRQHMQSHSLEYQDGGPPEKLHQRPFVCPVDGCKTSYRRKDHLNRHLLVHQGKLFECPFENCNLKFSIQGNMKRHLKEIHDRKPHVSEIDGQKKFICQEMGCGKEFTFKSKLRKHEDSHVKLESVEAFCADPCCMKSFTNMKCLKAHIQACHLHVICEVCGSRQLRKNIKRHLCSHQGCSLERIKCSFKDCNRTFTNKSNLQQHINSVHLELRPFVCGVPGCGMRFPFKHVRDKHEKSTSHVYVHVNILTKNSQYMTLPSLIAPDKNNTMGLQFFQGDLEEFDEHLRSGPRGGRKRRCPDVEMLTRKRVTPPSQSGHVRNDGSGYLSWLLSSDDDRLP